MCYSSHIILILLSAYMHIFTIHERTFSQCLRVSWLIRRLSLPPPNLLILSPSRLSSCSVLLSYFSFRKHRAKSLGKAGAKLAVKSITDERHMQSNIRLLWGAILPHIE